MKTNQFVTLTALIIIGMFFGISSMFNIPDSVMGWIISDVILGTILYINYLVIGFVRKSSKKSEARAPKRAFV